jgi:hypothetical protein
MKRLSWVIPVMAAAVVFLGAGIGACAKPQAQQSGNPSEIIIASCTACHDTRRICDNLGKKDRDAWEKTVTRMVEKGADVSKENIPAVVDYLTSLKPGSAPVCP